MSEAPAVPRPTLATPQGDSSTAWGPSDIAIIGMACRVPGANTPGQFWTLLREGRESRVELDDAALSAAGVPQWLIDNPNYVKAAMPLQQMEHFDPGFFGFSPLDGRILDPQHRHFLECSWEALEDAGHDPARFEGAIGVFAGSGHNAYLPFNLLSNPDLVADIGFFLLRHTGNDKDFLATRVSYCLDLRGPSVNVQTACSTSLVAIHAASQSLINGECDMALAGGVTIELPHRQGYLFKDSEILSRDGHCRPFDVSAGGTVFGSGVGVVVLRRMEDALAAGDNIHGVLRASAVNNDGAGKVSYLAPSVDGQAAAIQEALAIGDIDPRSVSYVEAHGTGTQLGDPIEVAALTQAYGGGGDTQFCGIGSVKSNIGHLDTAAGVASLIKVLLAMRHRQLPATLHWTAANAAIDFASTPFRVNATLCPWDAAGPLRAGVSSLGVGGTNAHLIVEEAPVLQSSVQRRARQLLPFSARSEQALLRGMDRLARHLEQDGESGCSIDLADAAWTLAVGRKALRRRAFLLAADAAEAVAIIDAGDRDRLPQAEAPASPRGTVFMFAGGGAQYPGMGRGLYVHEPVYRAAVDECVTLLRAFVDYDLKALLYPADDSALHEAARTLERPSRTLPALFVTQYAQARLWQSWGVQPEALIGHSMGENTAACIAGVLSLRDALGLVALRGRLFEAVDAGSMLSVDLDEAELTPLLGESLCIAAINAPGLAVASGPVAAIAELEARLTEREVGHRRIRIDVAAHSQMLDGILGEFGDYLRSIRLHAPSIPFVSNRSGTWITDGEATDPEYWVAHLRHTVRFADGAATLLRGQYVLLEVGPGRTLASLAGLHGEKRADQAILASMRHPDDTTADEAHMLATLGRLWLAGVEVDWARFHGPESLPGQQRRRISLPTYAFDHQRCWVEPGTVAPGANAGGRDAAARGETLADWLYQPAWQRQRLPVGTGVSLGGARVLLLAATQAHARPLVDALLRALRDAGADVRLVQDRDAGAEPAGAPGPVRLDVAHADDYVRLVDRLREDAWTPTHIVHALCLDLGTTPADDPRQRALAFDSLFHLAQVAGQEDWQDVRWLVLTADACQVAGELPSNPMAALSHGPMRVLPREFPGWRCSTLDVEAAALEGGRVDALAARILDELRAPGLAGAAAPTVALRGTGRFLQVMQAQGATATPSTQDVAADARPVLQPGAAYLVTGGTGGLGLVAAQALERVAAAAGMRITLVLLARRALPARAHWEALIAEEAAEAGVLRTLLALEGGAADIVLETGDVADALAMHALADRLRARVGDVRGLLHTAGVVDDALLLGKDIVDASRVLAPKVRGTLALAQAFDFAAMDFVALYSSTSAFAGLPGQVDYAAANAFEDAFAQHASAHGANVVAINWPAWRDTGMAAALAGGHSGVRLPAGRPVAHPLLDRCLDDTAGRTSFATDFSLQKHWVLREHRIKDGPALLPGSAFVELARAAWREAGHADGVCIEDAQFELPFVVGDHEHKALLVELEHASVHGTEGARFVLRSHSFGDTVDHARGRVAPLAADWQARTLDLNAIGARCTRGVQRFDDPEHHPHLSFGARWEALVQVRHGAREALIDLALPPQFEQDLQQYGLHPALYDMATAGAQVIIDGYAALESFYVPVGCERLRFAGTFPARSTSHVTYRGPDPADPDVAVFDIAVCDADARVFLAVDGFSMRRVGDVNAFRQLAPRADDAVPPALARTLELGIDAREGSRALLHILGAGLGPQAVVSPYRLDYLQAELVGLSQAPAQVNAVQQHDADADADIPAVEQALLGCDAIAEVVVRAFAEATGERRFVAFFVPDFAHFGTTAEIRRFARTVLPAELQPQQFVELDELPRGTGDTGSAVDRTSLRDPLAPADRHIPPRTTTEKALARIWQDVLGVARVGLADNFFDLGGHSLLSTRVIVQVYKRMGVRLDQATMVLSTLEQIAHDVDRRQRAAGTATPTPGDARNDEAASAGMPAAAAPAAAAGGDDPPHKGRGLFRNLFGGKP